MRVGELGLREFGQRLHGDGLRLRLGPFEARIRVDVDALTPVLHRLYAFYPLPETAGIADFHIRLTQSFSLRRLRREGRFLLDGTSPLLPHPARHAFPSLEWGMNWCIATRAQHFLMLHAAVAERHGHAILLPAAPGFGKSTLCTALVHSGWRLLSDEFGLVRPQDGSLIPIPRLIPLKNQSIDVIRAYAPEAVIGPSFPGTHKGTVAHVRPPEDGFRRMDEPARPAWLVFPRWEAGAALSLGEIPQSQAAFLLASNAFNYEVLGETAFRLVTGMVRGCACRTLVYSDLHEAVAALNELSEHVPHG